MLKNKFVAGAILLIGLISTLYFKFNNDNKNPLFHVSWTEKYGIKVNGYRDSLNLPLLSSEWVIHYFDSTHVLWGKYPKGVTTTDPMHLAKVVRFDRYGLPSSEKDEFHNETTIDSIAFRLICIYSFTENTTSFEFIEYYPGGYRWPPNVGYPVSHSFADSIFSACGIATKIWTYS